MMTTLKEQLLLEFMFQDYECFPDGYVSECYLNPMDRIHLHVSPDNGNKIH